ncbi:hypothetical protein Vadar_033057 [Vaccinium darrowii]|uniref:Uncharacterized protein n=1 Tax=Vaccinium darrowii TaxID=229202 RepID=A0ACB7ZGX8_9ERIC|nr:hypothetical protein Vadar_033057 [Vaccinium darrowii]
MALKQEGCICKDSLSLWKQLLRRPKFKLYIDSVSATLNSFRLERIPFSNRYHWLLGSVGYRAVEATMRANGDKILKELVKHYKGSIVPPNSPQSIRVNSILNKIVEAMHCRLRLHNSGKWKITRFATEHLDGMQWKVMVVKSKKDHNAMYLTNGTIVVFTRLLKTLQTDAEVATVLGHEVAHVLARHALEKLTRCYRTVTILPQLMFIPYSEIPLALVFSFCSRRREMEADYIGMMLMASAGYDPQLAPTFYESQDDTSSYHGKFATHPSWQKRAKKLKEPKATVPDLVRLLHLDCTDHKSQQSSDDPSISAQSCRYILKNQVDPLIVVEPTEEPEDIAVAESGLDLVELTEEPEDIAVAESG